METRSGLEDSGGGVAAAEVSRRRASSREAMAITLTVMERSLVWNQSVLCIITPGNWVKASQLTVPLVWVGAPLGVQAGRASSNWAVLRHPDS